MAHYEGRTLRRALYGLLLISVIGGCYLAFVTLVSARQLDQVSEQSLSTQTNAGATQSAGGALATCTPGTYQLPNAIDLGGYPVGVSIITDSPQQYAVYGATPTAINEQIRQCAPGGEYAAQASYTASWQYNYAKNQEGRCVVSSPKIGMHLNMVLPQWQANSNANPGTQSAWDSFISSLTNHEAGHYAISRQHAERMLDALQQVTTQNCADMTRTVDSRMNGALAELESAQQAYDDRTNHGATQGAVL